MAPAPAARVPSSRDRWFIGAVAATAIVGLWCRLRGLSHGSLYRDDAWVALTSRVPWHDAWRMVGTAPGFVLFERFWVGLTAPATEAAQLPTLVASIVAMVVVAIVARWWKLSRPAALLATALIAVGRVDITYATHLKPYATDVIAGAVVLWAAERWRRGRGAWWFAGTSLAALAVSFSVGPVVVGCGVVLGLEALRAKRWRTLVGPALLLVLPFALLYWRVHAGISPQLKKSWAANFFSFTSFHTLLHSTKTIIDGLIWGFIDTTPHWHVPGLSKAIIAAAALAIVVGACRWRQFALPAASIVAAVVFAATKVAPLGTGRTDAYLYPAMAILAAGGVEGVVRWIGRRRRELAHATVALACAAMVFVTADEAAHRPSYPGGSIVPVAQAVNVETADGGGVIIEGTARWPWTYYEEHPVHLIFSDAYNNGFAPVSTDPAIYIMPGTIIEGGYDPSAAVAKMAAYSNVLYVRTDDWPTLGDPLRKALKLAGYREYHSAHDPGYILEWWHRVSG